MRQRRGGALRPLEPSRAHRVGHRLGGASRNTALRRLGPPLRRCHSSERLHARPQAAVGLTDRLDPSLGMYAAPPRPRGDEDMSDWTTDAADAIDNAIGLVRERTVEPVQAVARVVIYGVLAALVLLPALTLTTIALFRVLTIAANGNVWVAWTVLGGIFVAAGWF